MVVRDHGSRESPSTDLLSTKEDCVLIALCATLSCSSVVYTLFPHSYTGFHLPLSLPLPQSVEANNPDTKEQSQILQNTNGLFTPNENFKEALYMQKRPSANINVPISRKTKSTNQVVEKGYHLYPLIYSEPVCDCGGLHETSCFVGNKQQS